MRDEKPRAEHARTGNTHDAPVDPVNASACAGCPPWMLSNRADPAARVIADRHYNRQKVGSPQFVPPGRCVVLVRPDAFWVTSWPYAEFVKHEWAGAWICSAFRNEGPTLSSSLIRSAVAATRAIFGEPPARGMVTFVDPSKVRTRGPLGWCYRKAGFRDVGRTKGGLVALQILPEHMPAPELPPRAVAYGQTRLGASA